VQYFENESPKKMSRGFETHKFKIVLLGEGHVGKTSILLRYIENRFSEKQESTYQATCLEKRINLGSTSVILSIWDTAGQERFHALAPIYYRNANGAILVYDITDHTSFIKVQHWIEELRKTVGFNIVLMMASNKDDLSSKRQVPIEEANNYATQVNAKIFATSAKTGKGVEEIFLELTKALLQQQKESQTNEQIKGFGGTSGRVPKVDITVVDDSQPKPSSSCCQIL